MTLRKHNNRDTKIEKRRNMREQNSAHKEKGRAKKIKKRYNKNDESLEQVDM